MLHYRKPRQSTLFKICIYCGAEASTKDHVPPKLLLERPFPPNLRKVPSCRACNEGYADDERYIRDALHQVGFGEISRQKLSANGVVTRSLEHSPKLKRMIEAAHRRAGDGKTVFVPKPERFERVFVKIARGLWYLDRDLRMGKDQVRCLSIDHVLQKPSPLPEAFGDRGHPYFPLWPEAGSRLLEEVAQDWPTETIPRTCEIAVVQDGVFDYVWVKHAKDGRRYLCVINLYDTLRGTIEGPE